MRKCTLSGLLLALALLPTSLIFGQGSVTLDYIGGQIGPDTLCADRPLVFGFRLTNTSGAPVTTVAIGFVVYSPDGATWGGTSGKIVGDINTYLDVGAHVLSFSPDGISADTVGFGGAALGVGIPADYDELALAVRIEKGDNWSGHTICIDSASFFPPWEWDWGGTTPTWDGPYCFNLIELPCLDTDNDGVLCGCDNCDIIYNPDQMDEDFDYVGDACQCCGTRGDINHSGGVPDIADVTCMVGCMFKSQPPPPCFVESDLNGDNSRDIADLTALVGFMFKSGDAPPGCP